MCVNSDLYLILHRSWQQSRLVVILILVLPKVFFFLNHDFGFSIPSLRYHSSPNFHRRPLFCRRLQQSDFAFPTRQRSLRGAYFFSLFRLLPQMSENCAFSPRIDPPDLRHSRNSRRLMGLLLLCRVPAVKRLNKWTREQTPLRREDDCHIISQFSVTDSSHRASVRGTTTKHQAINSNSCALWFVLCLPCMEKGAAVEGGRVRGSRRRQVSGALVFPHEAGNACRMNAPHTPHTTQQQHQQQH